MTLTTWSILFAYVVLIAFSLVFDPKSIRGRSRRKRSIMRLLFFSTFKMLLVIGIVAVLASIDGVPLRVVAGLNFLQFSWKSLAFGMIAAFGFIIIYLLWQSIDANVRKHGKSDRNTASIVNLLPKQWLPLTGVFLVISLEAGLLEEIFFRGIMQSHMYGFVAAPWAAVASGVLFGIVHFYQGISGLIGTSALGIWLGITYAITGNLLVPIVGHFLGDFACMMLGARAIVDNKKQR